MQLRLSTITLLHTVALTEGGVGSTTTEKVLGASMYGSSIASAYVSKYRTCIEIWDSAGNWTTVKGIESRSSQTVEHPTVHCDKFQHISVCSKNDRLLWHHKAP